jgi:hypothetical protein
VEAVGVDTWALEVTPFERDLGMFEFHQILPGRNGIYILENMNTDPLLLDKS